MLLPLFSVVHYFMIIKNNFEIWIFLEVEMHEVAIKDDCFMNSLKLVRFFVSYITVWVYELKTLVWAMLMMFSRLFLWGPKWYCFQFLWTYSSGTVDYFLFVYSP